MEGQPSQPSHQPQALHHHVQAMEGLLVGAEKLANMESSADNMVLGGSGSQAKGIGGYPEA